MTSQLQNHSCGEAAGTSEEKYGVSDTHPDAAGALGAEGVLPYDDSAPKGKQVEKMFDTIAPAYDFMNAAMTFGMHRMWRRRALRRAFQTRSMRLALASEEGPRILDVATGTGDVAIDMARRIDNMGLSGCITGADLSEGMLDVARGKCAMLSEDLRAMLRFETGDCLNLKYPDSGFDLITVAYGVRNFQRLADGLCEMARVLRPGGTLCILELSVPRMPHIRFLYNIYSRFLIPLLGRLVSGDSKAYRYLPQSIAAAPQREHLAAMMRQSGLDDCSFRSMTLGVVTVYFGVRPAAAPAGDFPSAVCNADNNEENEQKGL